MAAPRTLMSFGGHPQRFTFTPPLQLPGVGAQSLLIVESDEDLSLLRLDSDLPEITVPLTNGSDTQPAVAGRHRRLHRATPRAGPAWACGWRTTTTS